MNTSNNNENSELSSDSSWTFIHHSKNGSRKNSYEVIAPSGNITKEVLEQKLEDSSKEINNSDASSINIDNPLEKPKETGKLKHKIKKSKKKRKNVNETYKETMNFLTITACLFIITGITLLTTFLPPNYVESAEIEDFQNSLVEVYERTNNPTDKNAIDSLNAAKEFIDAAKSMDLFNVSLENLSDEDVCEALSQDLNKSFFLDDTSEFKITLLNSPVKEVSKNDKKSSVDSNNAADKAKNKTRTFVEIAKDLIKNPSLQIFIATLIQDFCLIKLISEFTKVTKLPSTTESQDTPVKKLSLKAKKLIVVRKKPNKPGNNNEKTVKRTKLPEKLTTDLLNKSNLKSIDSLDSSKYTDYSYEDGRSECARRFEELDAKGATLDYNHLQNIQDIKDKFQKEIYKIKEKEKGNYTRSEKVRYTREKFLQRLKSDREIYLLKLRKIREERKKILDDLCHGPPSINLGSKDASVGNYAVIIPESYSFGSNILKGKESNTPEKNINLTSFHTETLSYVPFHKESIASVKENKEDLKKKETNDRINKYCELKRQYLRKKAQLLHKRKYRTSAIEINNIVNNSSNRLLTEPVAQSFQEPISQLASEPLLKFAPESASQTSVPKIQEEINSEAPNVTENDNTGFQIVRRPKSRKRNLKKLYQAAFNDQSSRIEEGDAKKWKKVNFHEYNWVSPQGILTKQDPLKSHRTKIMHKGVL